MSVECAISVNPRPVSAILGLCVCLSVCLSVCPSASALAAAASGNQLYPLVSLRLLIRRFSSETQELLEGRLLGRMLLQRLAACSMLQG